MRLFSLVIAIILLVSCNNKNEKPDVSNIKVDVRIERFDKAFFAIDTNQLQAGLTRVNETYPSFLQLYFEYFSPINFIVRQQGKTYNDAVREYLRLMKSLEDSVQVKFTDVGKIERGLEDGLRHVKFYYPSFKVPAVLTSVESLNPENKDEIYGTTYYNDTLVISLQMFLGKDYPAYDPSLYFDYIRRRFEPEYIVPNSIKAIANTIYTDSSEDASLIEQMIEKGKQWYLLDHFLPDTHDTLKTFFTKRQLDWCKENEGNIWSTILGNNPDLYTVDKERIQSYIGEAPFTNDLPHEVSPGNIGQWVGWQIVKKFAAKNTGLSIQQVLATPARKIFQEAKYKPK
jgi:hypothetical protein